jgi:hypothetical protein
LSEQPFDKAILEQCQQFPGHRLFAAAVKRGKLRGVGKAKPRNISQDFKVPCSNVQFSRPLRPLKEPSSLPHCRIHLAILRPQNR